MAGRGCRVQVLNALDENCSRKIFTNKEMFSFVVDANGSLLEQLGGGVVLVHCSPSHPSQSV